MLDPSGPASSSRGEGTSASSTGGLPQADDVVAAAVELIGQLGLSEPPAPPEDDEQALVSLENPW